MLKKNQPDTRGFIFSTDPGFRFEPDPQTEEETLPPAQQKLRIRLDTKHRAGKMVTLITEFKGTHSDREELGKKLKNYCGTGGSTKEREIIIQGDQREKVLQWLVKNEYVNTKKCKSHSLCSYTLYGLTLKINFSMCAITIRLIF